MVKAFLRKQHSKICFPSEGSPPLLSNIALTSIDEVVYIPVETEPPSLPFSIGCRAVGKFRTYWEVRSQVKTKGLFPKQKLSH